MIEEVEILRPALLLKEGTMGRTWWEKTLITVMMIGTLSVSGCGYNDLQGLDEDTKAAWSEVINQYQRRADLIPNLVATVKGYAAHEKDTLEGVVQARAQATGIQVTPEMLKDPVAFEQFQKAQAGLTSEIGRASCREKGRPWA